MEGGESIEVVVELDREGEIRGPEWEVFRALSWGGRVGKVVGAMSKILVFNGEAPKVRGARWQRGVLQRNFPQYGRAYTIINLRLAPQRWGVH